MRKEKKLDNPNSLKLEAFESFSAEAKPPRDFDSRTAWFREARLGMFIHWGIYSLIERGEWVMFNEAIPQEELESYARRFNPKPRVVNDWVVMAKRMGARYVVLTTRHHDGFCLWDSSVSNFSSARFAPCRCDFVAEYVRAVRQAGLRVGLYYSLLDWRKAAYHEGPVRNPRQWRKFVDEVHAQVEELMTRYGKIDILWYDGSWPWDAKAWRSRELNAMVRKHQPHILINNRSGLPEDFQTPEQEVTPFQTLWETPMTLNTAWGYHASCQHWKSSREILHTLVRCVNSNGNFILNIGPRGDGSIPKIYNQRLAPVGRWLSGKQGESIYGCGLASNVINVGYYSSPGLYTQKKDRLYAHLLRWPGKNFVFRLAKARVRNAKILLTGRKLRVRQEKERVMISGLSKQAPDLLDTVISMEMAITGKMTRIRSKFGGVI